MPDETHDLWMTRMRDRHPGSRPPSNVEDIGDGFRLGSSGAPLGDHAEIGTSIAT